jgi:hypothetical protein
MEHQAKFSGLQGNGNQQEAKRFQWVSVHQGMALIFCTTHMNTAPGTLKLTCKQ